MAERINFTHHDDSVGPNRVYGTSGQACGTFIRHRIEEARYALIVGFCWDQTTQGQKYWEGVHGNLKDILDDMDDYDKEHPDA